MRALCARISAMDFWMAVAALLAAFLLVFAATQSHAQTFTVIHNFTGGPDGGDPFGVIAIDRAGNLYGSSDGGANNGTGVVFKLAHARSGWVFTPLHTFSLAEGAGPVGVTLGPDGNVYGATARSGAGGSCNGAGCGSVFKISPQPTRCASVLCPWVATILYRFAGGAAGGNPSSGVTLDSSGNVYGVAPYGYTGGFCLSDGGCGLVYQVTHPSGQWLENVLYDFTWGDDGAFPEGILAVDSAGNLFGSTSAGGTNGNGTLFQLTPSGSGWSFNTLYSFGFCCDVGVYGSTGLILDASGTLYGMTPHGGIPNCQAGCGVVFSLTPANGSWVYNELYRFTGLNGDGNPLAPLAMDAAGNLYGTTQGVGSIPGTVFKLTPSSGSWTYSLLHQFSGPDGYSPRSNVVIDANGNLYGTTYGGGSRGDGTVWEITP